MSDASNRTRAAVGRAVVDVSRFVSGPLCTFFLASMGAEVIAIEPPVPIGEPAPAAARAIPRAARRTRLRRRRARRCRSSSGHAASAAWRIDITQLRRPATSCAALAERRRRVRRELAPGGDGRLRPRPRAISRARNPRLVYCAISGYGQADDPSGPRWTTSCRPLPAAMAKTGFADGPPLRSGITIADHTTATFAALGIVAALQRTRAHRRGQLVDVAMLDVLTALRVRRARRPLRRPGVAAAHRQRRRARRADQHVPLRRWLGRRSPCTSDGAVRAAVRS